MSAVDADGRRVDPYRGLHAERGEFTVTGPYLLASAALILAYPLLSPVQRMVAFLLVSLPTLPAAVMGLRRTPVGQRVPWWLLLGALTSLNVDDVIWYWYVFVDGRSTGDGTIAGAFAALGQIFMLCGAISVVARRGRNDIGGMIDTTIVSMAVGGALWIFLLLPHLQAARVGLMTQVTTCVGVFMLTGILGALTRLLLTAKRLIPALWLLMAALACSLTGLITVSMQINPATGARPAWTDMIYMGGYAALTLFGLDRSVDELLRPGPTPRDHLSAARLAFLGLALGAMPVVGGVRHGLGQHVEGGLLATIAALVTPLVMLRIRRVAAERSWAEEALRYQVHHDPLTGLPNRREFADRLTAALRGGRQPAHRSGSWTSRPARACKEPAMTITTEDGLANRASVAPTPRLLAVIARRPKLAALLCYLANAAVIVGGAFVARALAPSWSGMAQSLIASVGVAAFAVVLLTRLRWWRAAGFNRPAQWRDLHLLALPAALTVVPVLTGFRPVSAGLLAMLITGYLLTGFMEEALWRGVVLRILRPIGTVRSVLLGSALFGAAHLTNVLFRPSAALVVAQAVGAACFGVGYAALRLRTNTIWPLMILHLFTDLFAAVGALPAIPILVAQDVILLAYGLWLLRRDPVRVTR